MPIDPNHPRPFLQRKGWTDLDGTWDFAVDAGAAVERPDAVTFDQRIAVPFAPETPMSGATTPSYFQRCWYRRTIDTARREGERLVLHLGAVDRHASVWLDGNRVAQHTGGFTPFAADLTPFVDPAATTATVVVQADDDPHDLTISRGKQDWRAEPHDIWYPRTTGIWQTPWLERVPRHHIHDVHWTSDPEHLAVSLTVSVAGNLPRGARLAVRLRHGVRTLVDDLSLITDSDHEIDDIRRTYEITPHDIDDPYRLIWRPNQPTLIDAELRIVDDDGGELDHVQSYCAIRSVGVSHDGQFLLNGRPRFLRMALDQGYWPDSGMTAPSVDALRTDVEMAQALGLNAVRKHQKLEDPRWLHQCDRLGLMVWEELPSAYLWSTRNVAELATDLAAVIARDRNHPSVIAWVPWNESWGVPLAATDAQQLAAVRALAELARALDPTRLVSANDGWETAGGQIVGVHDYAQDPATLRARYATAEALAATLAGDEPARRRILLDTVDAESGTSGTAGANGRAVVLSEMGGLTMAPSTEGLFSYGNTTSPDELVRRYAELVAAVSPPRSALAGWCWTQLTDTYQEANGLLTMARTPKAPIEQLRAATRARPGG